MTPAPPVSWNAPWALTPPLVDRDGNHNIKVGFAEPRSDGGSNAMLANIIEYGKSGQPAETLSQTRPDLVPEGLYQRHDPQAGRGEWRSCESAI